MYALILISVLQHERAFAFSAKHRVLEHIKGSFCSFPVANSELDFGDSGVCVMVEDLEMMVGFVSCAPALLPSQHFLGHSEPHGEPFHGISH